MADDATQIGDFILEREIQEVLHFTTNSGLLGILASRSLKSRRLLNEDQYLERLFTPNADFRRDPEWTGHVSLSISVINTEFFAASGRWHKTEDLWWAVLSLDPEILTHDGVVFTTTNNIYSGCKRGEGIKGLRELFHETTLQYLTRKAKRYPGMAENLPTCTQAEVLYPEQISTAYLRRVYVAMGDHAAVAEAQCASVGHEDVEVIVAPAVFA